MCDETTNVRRLFPLGQIRGLIEYSQLDASGADLEC
jgi:hypothetical protein